MRIPNLLHDIGQFVAPDHCIVCGERLNSNEEFICQKSLDRLPLAPDPQSIKLDIQQKIKSDLLIDDFISLYKIPEDSDYMKLIYKLKYNGLKKIAYFLGDLLSKKIELEKNISNSIIIPVPLHKSRKRERSYNQSTEIARSLLKKHSVSIREDLVKRNRYTESQTKFNDSDRMSNVSGVFELNKQIPNVNMIIILDDIITTGATVNSVAKQIRKKFNGELIACSVGIA